MESNINSPQPSLLVEPIVKPLTKKQIAEATRNRLLLIHNEFKAAFELLEKYPKSVSFFGSARFAENNEHYILAQNLSKRLAHMGYTIVTGGGPGIMEAANRGAKEAGGASIGITIKLPLEQGTNPYLTDKVELRYFFVRKVALAFAAETYIFFPGGFGTLDEFFEIITLVQTKKVLSVPVILVGADYWKKLDNFIVEYLYKQHQAISKEDLHLYTITDSEEEIIKAITTTPVTNSIAFKT